MDSKKQCIDINDVILGQRVRTSHHRVTPNTHRILLGGKGAGGGSVHRSRQKYQALIDEIAPMPKSKKSSRKSSEKRKRETK